MAESRPKSSGSVAAGASAAGAGGGTLLVLYANGLPAESKLRFWLLLAAPSVSVFLGVVWLWVRVEVANYVQWLKVKAFAKSAKVTLQESLNNPSTSEDHKKVIRARLEEVELLLTDHQMKRIRSVATITVRDVEDVENVVRADQAR